MGGSGTGTPAVTPVTTITDLCTLADLKRWLNMGVIMEPAAIPAAPGPYTRTVTQASLFQDDLYVAVVGGGALTKVAANPQAGQYSVAAGVYTFNAADKAKNVVIGYTVYHQDDIVLSDRIAGASEDMRQEIVLNLGVDDYDEYYSGVGGRQQQLWVRQYPIVSVTSLTIDSTTIPVSTDRIVSGYTFPPLGQKIVLIGYTFTRGRDNIHLQYRAGYATIPADIKDACTQLAALRYKSREWIGHKSKSMAGQTTTFVTDHMPEYVMRVCQRYKKVIPS